MLTLELSLHKFSRSLGCNGRGTSGPWVMSKEPTVFQKDHGAGRVKRSFWKAESSRKQEGRAEATAVMTTRPWNRRGPRRRRTETTEEQKQQCTAEDSTLLPRTTSWEREDRLSQSMKKPARCLLKMKWQEGLLQRLDPHSWRPAGGRSGPHRPEGRLAMTGAVSMSNSGRQKCGPAHKGPARSPADHQAEGGRDGSPWRGTRDSEGTSEGCSWSWELRRGKWSTVNTVKRGGRQVQDAPTALAVLVTNTLGNVRCPPLRTKQDNDYLESKQPRISAWSFLLNKKFLLETSRCYNLVRFTVKI